MIITIGTFIGNSALSGQRDFIIPATFNTYFTNTLSANGGAYTTNYNFETTKSAITGNTAYVDPNAPGGGSGTEGSPFNNLATAIANSSFNIYRLKRGSRFKLTAGITISRSLAIMDYGSTNAAKPQVTSQIDLTFAAHATYANVYQATSPQTTLVIGSVFDETNIDSNGISIGLVRKASPEEVRDNANSYYYDATTDILYVRTFNNRAPDSDIVCLLSSTTFRLFRFNQILTSNTKIYMENIDVYGGLPLVINNTDTTFYWDYGFNNCHFSYGGQKDGSLVAGHARGFFKDCRADYNFGDGFNYSNNPGFALEWNCKSWYNDANSDSNNGSTSHLAFYVIRVNGDYQFSGGKGVQDINDVKSLCLGCVSKNSRALNAAHKAGYASNSSTGTTEMWLIECEGPLDANKFWLFNNSTMHIFDGAFGNLLTGSNQQDVGGILDILDESEVYY